MGHILAEGKSPNSLADRMLMKVAREWRLKSIRTGRQHKYLQLECQRRAKYQAKIHLQGHHNWEEEYHKLNAKLGMYVEEDTAESWAGSWKESGHDLHQMAVEMMESWKASPGHWASVNGPCKYWGYSMRMSDEGVWYANAIFAKTNPNTVETSAI